MRNIVVAGLAALAVACGSSAPAADGLTIAIADGTVAGIPAAATVSLVDAAGLPRADFRGTVHFSSEDVRASLPADYQFTAADGGSHSFQIVLFTAGTPALTVAATGGTSATVRVDVQPGIATVLGVGTAQTMSWCSTSAVRVAARDAYANVATSYRGTVHFVSDDPEAVLPADYAFTSADAGQHEFQVGLRTAGARTIAVTDGPGAITGSAVSQATGWCAIGPDRGDIQALAADPGNPWVVYAGTAGAGIFKTIDGGATWAPASDGLASADIDSIVVDPTAPSTVYAGGHVGIYKSTDGGTTWSEKHGADVAALVLDPSSADVIFAATAGGTIDSGVLRSTDGGTTWTEVGNGFGLPVPAPGMTALALDPAAPSVLYGAFGDGSVYRTGDRGENWSRLTGPVSFEIVRSLAVDSHSVVFLGTNSGSYTSSDRGASWTLAPLDTFSSLMRIDPRSPSVVYCGGGLHSTFKTVDGGATWTVFDLPGATAIVADPLGGVALAGTVDRGVFQSTDRLATWVPANGGLHAAVVEAIALAPGSATDVFASSPGGFSVSSDGGATWKQTSVDFDAASLAVDPRSPAIVYAAGADGAWKSIDSGTSWNRIAPFAGPLTSVVIAPEDPSTVYFGTQGSGVLKTTDGGLSGAATALSGAFVWALALDPQSPGTVYATTSPGPVFKTSDGGATWSVLPGLPTDTGPVPIAVLPDSTVLVGFTATVFQSRDRGASFNASHGLPPFFFSQALAADPLTPGAVYFSADAGLFKSVDGGTTFFDAGAPLRAHPRLSGLAVAGNTLYAASGGAGIFKNFAGAR